MRVTLALVEDTFREAFARWIFWGLFALSTLMILFFILLTRIDVVEGAYATVSLFGRNSRDMGVQQMIRGIYGSIATFIYTFGMALAVFASAGLIPRVLEPGRIELILSKPVSRHRILLGRFLGNMLVVAGNIAYLVTSFWLILGIKTGIWDPKFLITIATAVFIFTVLLSVVLLIGVIIESTALATMVTVGLMIMSPILAQTSTAERLLSSETSRQIWRGLYYVLPKVYDVGRMTLDIVRGNGHGDWMPLWTSALFAVVMVGAALTVFSKRDF